MKHTIIYGQFTIGALKSPFSHLIVLVLLATASIERPVRQITVSLAWPGAIGRPMGPSPAALSPIYLHPLSRRSTL
jgi:hypothetical protein